MPQDELRQVCELMVYVVAVALYGVVVWILSLCKKFKPSRKDLGFILDDSRAYWWSCCVESPYM